MKRDRQATIDKQFLDPRSYVTPDGREVLYGEDWDARVEDLRLRSGGKCEWIGLEGKFHCLSPAQDPDHIVKRSKKRDDRLSNLQALCRYHHDLKHPEFRPKWTPREPASRKAEA